MDLTLKDFQSWKEATLKLEGFTVVVGPSNRGKSALARAARAILRNGISEGQVRLGSKQARVALSLAEHEIESSRPRKGSASYVVDGEEFAALGGNVPPVMRDWGYQPVEVNGVKIDPVFAGQFDAQFLLSSSPAETNAILNAFSSTERLDRGKKTLKGKVGEKDSEAKVLGGQISTLEEQVALLQVKAEAAELLRQLIAQRMATARAAQRQAVLLAQVQQAITRKDLLYEHLQKIDRAGDHLARVLQALARLVLLAKLHLVINQRRIGASKLQALEVVEPKLDRSLKAYLRLERLARLHTGVRRQAQGAQQLAVLARIPPLMDEAARRYKILVRARALVLADPAPYKARAARIKDINASPAQGKLAVLTALARLIDNAQALAATRAGLSSQQEERERNEVELRHAEADLDQWVDINAVITCPQCHYEFVKSQGESHDQHR